MIKMMCGARLVDRVPTDVLHDRVSVVMKIGDMITQKLSAVAWSCHVWRQLPNTYEVMKLKKPGKGRRANQGNRGKNA